MTRNEAIEILEAVYFLDEEKQKALNMAIEALERKRGDWIIEEDGYYPNSLYTAFCSNCRHYVNWFEDKYGGSIIRELPDYCSNCGSEMCKILPKD